MEALLQDFRFAGRILWRSAGTTLAIITALALGIGANSAMYTIVDASVFHAVSYSAPEQLSLLWELDSQGVRRGASAANFLDWRVHSRSFSELAARASVSYVLQGRDRPQQVAGSAVTANFFRTLGVKPLLGRTFLGTEDGLENSAPSRVCVIGYKLWHERWGGDPQILGRTVTLDQNPYIIVGVMPADFWFISSKPQIWAPILLDHANREYRYLTVVGRRKASSPQTTADLAALAHSMSESYPESNRGWKIEAGDLRDWLANRSFRTRILLLAGALILVLLIACANAASLLLARSATRTREMATRISVGATRSRLIRQLLTESLALGLAGGCAGLLIGHLLIEAARLVLPPNALPNVAALTLNMRAAFFTMGIALTTGLVFGLAPALMLSGANVQNGLRDSGRSITGGRKRRLLRKVVVIAEVALAFLLVVSTSLMLESMRKLAAADLGFRPHNVLAWSLYLPAERYDAAFALRLHRRVLEQIAALPGVESATVSSGLPLHDVSMEVPFDFEPAAYANGERPGAGYQSMSPEYLQTLGIVLKRGRTFTRADNEKSPAVAIVNEAFVERFTPDRNPVGERVIVNRPLLDGNGFGPPVRLEIVGVIGNVALGHLAADPIPTLYVPHAQDIWSGTAWFAIRTRLNASTLNAAVRRTMHSVIKDAVIENLTTLDDTFAQQFAQLRFQAQLMAGFAVLALLLAVSGVYSLNAEAVAQRKHEIGLRMALGASPGQLMTETIAGGLKLTVLGLGVGVAAALAAASLLKTVVAGVDTIEPLTLAGVAALLGTASVIATAIPARSALRVDPAIALRQE